MLALLAACAGPPAWAAQALGCLIEPERVVDVGSPVIGVIQAMAVERGAPVRRGQVLATLRADVERASFGAASLRAQAEAEVQGATTSASFNKERAQRAEELFGQNFISQQALQQARTEALLAEQKLSQAIEQRRVSQQERDVAAAQLSQRTIRSPIDGVVAERYLSAGERVDDKPLLRIAKVNPLRVQLVVPIALYGQMQIGSLASVLPDLPGAKTRSARVTLVDKVVDPASNTFRVHLELPNADLALPAGLRCKAEFPTLAAPEAKAEPAAVPTAAAAKVAKLMPVSTVQTAPAVPKAQMDRPIGPTVGQIPGATAISTLLPRMGPAAIERAAGLGSAPASVAMVQPGSALQAPREAAAMQVPAAQARPGGGGHVALALAMLSEPTHAPATRR